LSEKKTQKRFDVGKKLATCNMNLFAPSFSLEISGRPYLEKQEVTTQSQ